MNRRRFSLVEMVNRIGGFALQLLIGEPAQTQTKAARISRILCGLLILNMLCVPVILILGGDEDEVFPIIFFLTVVLISLEGLRMFLERSR